jgi:glyoxylase-like metal-dependent hydrolase (beta-lactamase superfamily II)
MPPPAFEALLIEVDNAGPFTGTGNNTYLLASPGVPACLIDAGVGTAAHLDRVAHHLATRHTSLSDVLVTHAHPDHSSGAPSLAARFGVRRFIKHQWPEHDDPGVDWQHTTDGTSLQAGGTSLVVLHTPGHSPDHLSFWHQPSGTIFTGDLVNQLSSVAIIFSRGGSLSDYLHSLERLLLLNPARLLPGHGPPIERPADILRATLVHRRAREGQVTAAVAAGHETVQAIADSIYHGLQPALMPLARENVRAHLEKLKTDGRVVDDGDRWRPSTT